MNYEDIKVGEKYKVKPEFVSNCGSCNNSAMDYIIVTNNDSEYLSYTSHNEVDSKLNACSGCYKPSMLELYEVTVVNKCNVKLSEASCVLDNAVGYIAEIDTEIDKHNDIIKTSKSEIKRLTTLRKKFELI